MNEHHPDAELVGRARNGDTAAFVALCERHRGRIWRIVTSVARRVDAEDLAQETIVRAYRALGTYQGAASFETWLTRIAVNVAHDYQRSAWRRRVTCCEVTPGEDEEATETTESAAERRELQRRVRQAVAALPEAHRVPVWLHYFEGISLTEVAKLERIPESTIRSRVRAGLRRLSKSLQDVLPAPECPAALETDPKGCGA